LARNGQLGQAIMQGWPSGPHRGGRDISLEKPMDPSYLTGLAPNYAAQPFQQIIQGYFDRILRANIAAPGSWTEPTDSYEAEVVKAFNDALRGARNDSARDHFAARKAEILRGFKLARSLQNFMRYNVQEAARIYQGTGALVSDPNNVVRDYYSRKMSDIALGRVVDFGNDTVSRFANYWRDYGGMEQVRKFYNADNIAGRIQGSASDYDAKDACLNKGVVYWNHLEDALSWGLPGKLTVEPDNSVSARAKFWQAQQYVESMNYQQNPAGMATTLRDHFIYRGNNVAERLWLEPDRYRLGDSKTWIPYSTTRSALSNRETVNQTNHIIKEADQQFGNKWWYCNG
jgi:hypothetical protein